VAREAWLDARHADLLPVPYFQVVFTLPHTLNGLVDANRVLLLNELFGAVAWVLQHFAADPRWRLEGQLGFLAVLHTWTQRLLGHFHIHCLVPGGVWQADRRRWVPCRNRWLFRKDSLADAFRNRFLHRLEVLRKAGRLQFSGAGAAWAEFSAWQRRLNSLREERWIVYPKPTSDAAHVLDYLGRYTHKVAISDHRIHTLANGQVTYRWRDRDDGNREKLDTLPVQEFIRRFLYHILPDGFQKIRYYGWLASACKKPTLAAIRASLNIQPAPPPPEESFVERILRLTGEDLLLCPVCRRGHLQKTTPILPLARGPP
jgi:hypothetical protein